MYIYKLLSISKYLFQFILIYYINMMTPLYSADLAKFHSSLFLVCILGTILCSHQIEFHSNFNSSKINDIVIGEPISLPFIVSATSQRKIIHTPSQVPSFSQHLSSFGRISQDNYKLKRYQLKDTHYIPEQHQLSQLQTNIIYNMQPPTSLFDVPRTITIEDYHLLQIRNIRMMFINPTDKFKFCINQIYTDSESIKRIQHKKLPFCLNPNNKYPFFFNLYISQHKPYLFRTTVYFIISIYEGHQLVDQKIWPRQIIAKVSQNHLKLAPIQLKNCSKTGTNAKNYPFITITNHHSHSIKLNFESEHEVQQKITPKQLTIPPQKNSKVSLPYKQSILAITTRGCESCSTVDNRFPKLYLPIICVKPLQINYFNIGVLNTERSVMQVLVPVTSNSKENIQIKNIQVVSSSQTIEVLPFHQNNDIVPPGYQHFVVCKLLIHIPKQAIQKTTIQIRIFYVLQSSDKQILESRNTYKFHELRNPLSLGARRFVDLKKPEDVDPIMSNIFPIRNNLNLPLILMRVTFDQKVFKLTWLKDRRQHIYPNQQRDQFSLQYIGPRSIKISPVKYIIMLQFNGNLIIPIQIVIYDHSLQCIHKNIQQKCQNLGQIDYGYFRNSTPKVKQLTFRNWNPVPKQVKISFKQNPVQVYGMDIAMNISKPSPNYDILFKSSNNSIIFYLKGNHFLHLYFTLSPLKNATSGQPIFQIQTQNEIIISKIKFKLQNGTIALIPQILRIGSAYQQTVQYLNLVSTFSQPYKIKSTIVNNSFISIFFNNHSQIFQNQWIGLALVYNPFQTNNNTQTKSTTPSGPLSTSTSTIIYTQPFAKLTEHCCGHQFITNSFINNLYSNQYKRFTHVSVRVITTTQLQANATIIIDNNPPKMIQQNNFLIQMVKYNYKNNGASKTSGLNNNNRIFETKDYTITVNNVFKEYVKFKPILVSRLLYEDTKQYVNTIKKIRKTYQNAMLCVNNSIAVKHNFSPQMVKMILGLDSIPQQVTIQPLDNQQYYVGSQKKNSFDSSAPQLTSYVRKTVEDGARVCYKMNVTKYLKQLIQSHIINDIAQSYSSEIFHQFVQKQLQFNNYNNTPLYYQEQDQFYDLLDYNFEYYCKKSTYPLFKFCKQIGVTVFPNTETVIQPDGNSSIVIKTVSKFRQSSQSFYVILLNNITKYEAHLIKVNITQPKLKIKKVYVSETTSISQNEKKYPQSKAYSHEFFIKKHLTKRDISRNYQIKQTQISENDATIKNILSSLILISLNTSDIKDSQYQGSRKFTLVNTGNIDINITHVGFQSQQNLCGYNGIELSSEVCKGFLIKSGGQFNISFDINIDVDSLSQSENFNMYLYSQDAFYFKFNFLVKSANLSSISFHKSFNSFLMNIVSFVFILLVIFRLKTEIDQKQEIKRLNIKTKIMSPSSYSYLGSRIEKKVRKLQTIPEDQILAVKQIHQNRQNKFKQFFNSSDESEIAKKQHTQQDQPSNIQILSALKNDRNSMSASEQSSIDFIDFNTLNKSNQNIQSENNNTQQNQKENQSKERDQNENENENSSSNQESQADSNFDEGNEIQQPINNFYDWGDSNKQKKKQNQTQQPYYNVFFSPNPLRTNQSAGLFHWMNDYQRSNYR